LGGYRFQGRTAEEAMAIVDASQRIQDAGAAGLLLEAVPGEVAAAVCNVVQIPVIGCGAGHPCHGSVVVTHDAIGLTQRPPRFVPAVGSLAEPLTQSFAEYVRLVSSGQYPAAEQRYEMNPQERADFLRATRTNIAARA
jgi:3-methyl-2-oxobutanoate hydroxymethyltransferase